MADGGAVQAEVMLYTYPDQRHDVEAMYVARNGDVVLITNVPSPTEPADFARRSCLEFRIGVVVERPCRGAVGGQLADRSRLCAVPIDYRRVALTGRPSCRGSDVCAGFHFRDGLDYRLGRPFRRAPRLRPRRTWRGAGEGVSWVNVAAGSCLRAKVVARR